MVDIHVQILSILCPKHIIADFKEGLELVFPDI